MTRAHILFLTAAILFGLEATPGLSAQSVDVIVQFVHPEKFTDFSIYGRDYRWSTSYFAGEISRDLRPELKRKFSGSKLTLRFTDVDLAGSYRTSSRGGSGVRVTRGERAPARMSFDFLLEDRAGRTLASGSTRITDASHHSPVTRPQTGSGPLYYEKRMLKRWFISVEAS
jgi:hypothetical protein